MQNICLQVFFHPKMYQPSRYLGTETGHQRTLLTGRKKSHGFQQVATLWDSLGSMRWNFFTPRSQTCHLAAASGVPKVSKAWPQLASRCSNKSWQETRVQRSGPMLPDAVVAVDPGIQTFFCCYDGGELRWRNWTRPNLVYSDCSDEDALIWFSWF